MNKSNIQKIAVRSRCLGKELLAIANQLEAECLHLSVNLPRDLFSDMDEPRPMLFDGIKDEPKAEEPEQQPVRRNYHRNPKRMTEHLAITSAERVGKAQGFCARNDIERSVARLTGRTREDVREAVNRIASRMQITCVKSRSYRYYPRSQRKAIVDAAIEELERI